MALLALATAFLASVSSTAAAVIDHDQVVGFPETVPSGITGTLDLKYKPFLKVVNGCVPFPAVNAQGDVSGGLNPTGSSEDDCDSSTGQVYSRSGEYNGAYAIMYAWYMPKDQTLSGVGHRHDWESIVVWLSKQSTSATLQGVAASAHGGFSTSTDPVLSGTGPLIQYISYFPLNHQLDFTSTQGGQQPLIAWESMPTVAQQALENTDWGDANVPFLDSSFTNNLAEASL